MQIPVRLLPAVLLALLSALGGCSSEASAETGPIRFSAIPDQNSTELKEKFDIVANYLSEQLGVPFEYVPSVDYGASVEAFKNGDIHLAWFGGLSGVRARTTVPGASAIAQGTIDPEFKSYFIANASLGLQLSDSFPSQLEGKSFTFGSHGSTSGRLMPEHFLRVETGKKPADFFGREPNYSGAHDKTAQLVESGAYQAGALSYTAYERLVAEQKIDPSKCVKIWETPTYPDYNWTAHPDLDRLHGAGFTQRIQTAIVAMQEPSLLKAAQREAGFIKASNEDFAPLETLARDLELLR